MIYEARFIGGPAEGEFRVIPDLMREVKVAHANRPRDWWANEDPLARITVEEHSYFPDRAVVYYVHGGSVTR